MIRKSSIFSNINDMLEDRGYEVDEVELENFLEDISDEEYFEIKKAIEKGQEDIIMEFIGDLPLRKKIDTVSREPSPENVQVPRSYTKKKKGVLYDDFGDMKKTAQEEDEKVVINSLEKLEEAISQNAMEGYNTLDTFFGGEIDREEAEEWFSFSDNYAEWNFSGVGSVDFVEGNTYINRTPFEVFSSKKTAQYGEFELYFDDLNNEAQNRLLAFMDLRDPAEGNFDVAPIAIIDYELEEEFEFEESISEEPRRRGKPLPDKERLERHKRLHPEEDIENEEDLPERGTGLGIRRRVTSTHKKKQQ